MSQAAHGASPAHPRLQHHFDDPVQQFDSGKLGMWLFLATEILLFGGLFCAYAVYRANHPEIFVYAHTFLNKNLGAVNTVILLCSSLTMAWGVRAAQLGQQRRLVLLLSLTIVGGCGFMGIKYVEYREKWQHGLLWAGKYSGAEEHAPAEDSGHAVAGAATHAAEPDGAAVSPPAAPGGLVGATAVPGEEHTQLPPAARGPSGMAEAEPAGHAHLSAPANAQIFFSIYFLMTGLHGLHVLAGMLAIGWILRRALRGEFSPAYFTPVDLVGLYWHLVDLIWIFLFPLLYLIH